MEETWMQCVEDVKIKSGGSRESVVGDSDVENGYQLGSVWICGSEDIE